MLALAIFDFEEEVIEKPIRSKGELKNFRFRGRKPDRLIIQDSEIKAFGGNKVLRASVIPSGLVITTTGRKIYDGKTKSLY